MARWLHPDATDQNETVCRWAHVSFSPGQRFPGGVPIAVLGSSSLRFIQVVQLCSTKTLPRQGRPPS